jgi:hypothetical protein
MVGKSALRKSTKNSTRTKSNMVSANHVASKPTNVVLMIRRMGSFGRYKKAACDGLSIDCFQ